MSKVLKGSGISQRKGKDYNANILQEKFEIIKIFTIKEKKEKNISFS